MALYIAKRDQMANYDFDMVSAQHDLLGISKFDSGVGEGSSTYIDGIECVPVTYTKTISAVPPDRLNVLVNNSGIDHGQTLSYFSDIIIAAVKDGYILRDGTTVVQDAITLPPWISDPRNPFNYICIFYNVQECAANSYQMWVKDTGGGTVSTDTALRLYHELSHALQYANGGSISDEVQAITEENEMRDMRGNPHRNVNDPAFGCGPAVPSPGTTDGGTTCFPSSTPVLTPGGWVKIGDLQTGDSVVSYHEETGQTRIRRVTKRLDHQLAQIWEVGIQGTSDVIPTTACHPFLTRRGWILASRLRAGDELITLNGSERVNSVRKTDRFEAVHNIFTTVEHTFIVQGHVVVHNFAYFRTLRSWWHRLFIDWKIERGKEEIRQLKASGLIACQRNGS